MPRVHDVSTSYCGSREDPESFVPRGVLHIRDTVISGVGQHGTDDGERPENEERSEAEDVASEDVTADPKVVSCYPEKEPDQS